jgi:hypothetical protein
LALGWRLMEEGKVQKAVKEGYEIWWESEGFEVDLNQRWLLIQFWIVITTNSFIHSNNPTQFSPIIPETQ